MRRKFISEETKYSKRNTQNSLSPYQDQLEATVYQNSPVREMGQRTREGDQIHIMHPVKVHQTGRYKESCRINLCTENPLEKRI